MKTYIQPQSKLYTFQLESMLAASQGREISADADQQISDIYSEGKDSWSNEIWDEE